MRKSLPSCARGFVLALLAALALAALVAVPAQAAPSEIGRFGPGGLGVGLFLENQSIAVEVSTGDVYVYESAGEKGNVYKFNEKGEPVSFSSLTGNVIEGVGGEAQAMQIAVDSSSGPNKGDIYVANTTEVLIYGSSGNKLPGTLTAKGGPCGVAVDPSGDVYVGFYGEEEVKKYAPTTTPVKEEDYTSSLWEVGKVCNLATDSAGDAYVSGYNGQGGVTKYEASQFSATVKKADGTVVDSNKAPTLAIDTVSGDVYIDEVSDIAVYTSSGALVEGFGSLVESYGVAVNPASGTVYAASENGEEEKEGEVVIFGSAIPAKETLGITTNTGTGTGTVECEVNKTGGFKACEPEYATGTELTLKAKPELGSELVEWNGTGSVSGCASSSSDECSFTITEPSTATAIFNAKAGGKGATGPAGPTGPAGSTGPSGNTGPTGSTGPSGSTGPKGEEGKDGKEGKAGTSGTNGEKGVPGPAGAAGGQGPVGPVGAQGPAGPPGMVELVTCKTVKKKGKSSQQCTTKLVSGTVKFTAVGASAQATLSRRGAVYAAGTARVAHGRISLRLTPLRTLRPGSYKLTLIGGAGRHETIRTEAFTLR